MNLTKYDRFVPNRGALNDLEIRHRKIGTFCRNFVELEGAA